MQAEPWVPRWKEPQAGAGAQEWQTVKLGSPSGAAVVPPPLDWALEDCCMSAQSPLAGPSCQPEMRWEEASVPAPRGVLVPGPGHPLSKGF